MLSMKLKNLSTFPQVLELLKQLLYQILQFQAMKLKWHVVS